jgi:hypothetical protein
MLQKSITPKENLLQDTVKSESEDDKNFKGKVSKGTQDALLKK